MEHGTREGLRHTEDGAFYLRGLGWLVVVAPVICAILFLAPAGVWLVSLYLLLALQWVLVWQLRHVARSPGWRRGLGLARRWLAVFIAGCPLFVLLADRVCTDQRISPFWKNATTFCACGVAALGLYMFYLHVTKAIPHLGGLIRSPGLAGIADQTLTTQKLVAALWLGVLLATQLVARLPELVAGLPENWGAVFHLAEWVLSIVRLPVLAAALVLPLLYWDLTYVWLLRQAAKEAARGPMAQPAQERQQPPTAGSTE